MSSAPLIDRILHEYLEVVCSDIKRLEKPDPKISRHALEPAGFAPNEALHAGDHPKMDIAGARAVGMDAVLVDHSGTCAPEDGGPVRVASLEELKVHVLELAG